jgi:hypothetical protein
MGKARIINAIFWLYVWLSNILNPVIMTDGNFWSEKAKQLVRLNEHVDDPARLVGNAIIPAVLWFAIDWGLRRSRGPKKVE